MNIIEAAKEIIINKKVRRKDWVVDYFIFKASDGNILDRFFDAYQLTDDDLLSEWEIYEVSE